MEMITLSKKFNIYTRYNCPPKVQEFNSAPSLTQQQFKEEADINNIIASYNTTGLLTNPLVASARQPMFGDFSNLPEDYMQVQNQLLEAQANFMDLPAKIRQRFNNNPAELIAFLQNPDNFDEAVELGLMEKIKSEFEPKPEPTPEPKPEPPAPAGAGTQ